jgi:hypothetical protein
MDHITIERPLEEKLGELSAPVVFYDTRGRALGVFSPLNGGPQTEEFDLEPPSSIAETEELRKIRTGKPLQEILRRLGLS